VSVSERSLINHLARYASPLCTLSADEKRFTSYSEPVPSSTKKAKASFLQISKRKVDSEEEDDDSAAGTAAAAAADDNAQARKQSPPTVETIVDKSVRLRSALYGRNIHE